MGTRNRQFLLAFGLLFTLIVLIVLGIALQSSQAPEETGAFRQTTVLQLAFDESISWVRPMQKNDVVSLQLNAVTTGGAGYPNFSSGRLVFKYDPKALSADAVIAKPGYSIVRRTIDNRSGTLTIDISSNAVAAESNDSDSSNGVRSPLAGAAVVYPVFNVTFKVVSASDAVTLVRVEPLLSFLVPVSAQLPVIYPEARADVPLLCGNGTCDRGETEQICSPDCRAQ